ncbi:MAG: hypothetical protein QM597_05550 [Aeromicrobium sp.]|uniref:hypothetical protein n=1 Tax=Aeromicrobium sp. TaxID=1871063 RepID=UPI0039E31980
MSAQIELRAEFAFDPAGGRSEVEELTDRLMLELQNLADSGGGIDDPALSVDLATCRLTVELVAQARNFDDAVALADASVRAAVHAAGWNTPEWVLQARRKSAGLLESA